MHTEYEGYQSLPRSGMRKAHLSHCFYVLLQNLMCEASVDIVTYNWMVGQQYPFPDFNLHHQCRDFEAILQWRKEHEVDGALYETIRPPEDIVLVRPPKELIYDIFSLGKGILRPQ